MSILFLLDNIERIKKLTELGNFKMFAFKDLLEIILSPKVEFS